MTYRARYFKPSEFRCRCGRASCDAPEMSEDFVRQLDLARSYAGVPFHVSSGTRCARHNVAVGGVPGSAHTLGLAADIAAPTDRVRMAIVRAAIMAGFERIGIGRTFVHLDGDKSKSAGVLWLY